MEKASARPRVMGVPVEAPPMRMPEGSKIASMGSRSFFDNPVPGSSAQKNLISMKRDPFVPETTNLRPSVQAMPVLGQDAGVERVIQRETPPEGVSREEAKAIIAALDPALAATALALEAGVTCGRVDSLVYAEVKKLRDSLDKFAASQAEAKAQLSPAELEKIDAVMACQKTYEERNSDTKTRTVFFVIGAIVVGAIVIAVTSK